MGDADVQNGRSSSSSSTSRGKPESLLSAAATKHFVEPHMSSQFPINYEEIDSDEEKENAKFKKILNQIKQKQQSSESAKKRKVCEEISSQSYATIESNTKSIAQQFKQQNASKIEELVQKLDRLGTRASVGRQKLLEAKKTCIDAVELHRESLKRLLLSLKEHEKETVTMRDVVLKETTQKEMARAVTQVCHYSVGGFV